MNSPNLTVKMMYIEYMRAICGYINSNQINVIQICNAFLLIIHRIYITDSSRNVSYTRKIRLSPQ